MKSKHFVLAVILFFFLSSTLVFAQTNRLKTSNQIGWYTYFGTFKLSHKLGLHTEYQFRRNELISYWQQSLLRIGLNYTLHPAVQVRVGYGWIETFPYGEYPLNGFGKQFTEHRIFQMAQLSQKVGKVDFSHRFMLEQRFVGKYASANSTRENEFPLLHRMRYLVRMQVPLKGNEIQDKTPYLAVYDEVFIGFGKNVYTNVFDQNRIGVLLGYRFNKTIRLEGGYLNQSLQYGRLINGKNGFQHNNGLLIHSNFTLDWTKK
ncbi:MAG: DUF2490 domain-containing protein [Algoriphagus sp.]|nr:DUF2490 domain-containing protein [Algoriphagus sp.]